MGDVVSVVAKDLGMMANDGIYQQGVHPAWIEVTAEIREGADVGTGVGERESEGSTVKDREKSGSRSTMNDDTEWGGTNRSTSGSTTGITDKETETNISGAGNGSEESKRNTVCSVTEIRSYTATTSVLTVR